MPTPCFERALIYMHTSGEEGRSPYFLSDVLSCLKEEGKEAKIISAKEGPLVVTMKVEGRMITITEEAVEGSTLLFVKGGGNGFVRMDAIRKTESVPVAFMDQDTGEGANLVDPLFEDWIGKWPSPLANWKTYAEKHFPRLSSGVNLSPVLSPLVYISERTIVDGILVVLRHAS